MVEYYTAIVGRDVVRRALTEEDARASYSMYSGDKTLWKANGFQAAARLEMEYEDGELYAPNASVTGCELIEYSGYDY